MTVSNCFSCEFNKTKFSKTFCDPNITNNVNEMKLNNCENYHPKYHEGNKHLDLEAYQRAGIIHYVANRYFSEFTQNGFTD